MFGRRKKKPHLVPAMPLGDYELNEKFIESMEAGAAMSPPAPAPLAYLNDPKWEQRVQLPGQPYYHDPFEDICREMVELHNRKGADYGSAGDPYKNVRASEAFGIPPWIGALVRLNDKIVRLQSFIRKGNLVNESVEDSMRDIAVYAVIMQILYSEGKVAPFKQEVTNMLIHKGVKAMMDEPTTPWSEVKQRLGMTDMMVTPEAIDEALALDNEQPETVQFTEPLNAPEPTPEELNLCHCDLFPEPHEPHIVRFIDGNPVLYRSHFVEGVLLGQVLEAVRQLTEEEYEERMKAALETEDDRAPS